MLQRCDTGVKYVQLLLLLLFIYAIVIIINIIIIETMHAI